MKQPPLLPSPMTPERLALLQRRLAAGKPLAVRSDNKEVSETMKRNHGLRGKPQPTQYSKYDEDGEEIDDKSAYALLDRYLSTKIGSREAAVALRRFMSSRQ